MSIVIGHGNGHNEPSFVDFVRDGFRRHDVDSFGCHEAQRLLKGKVGGDLDDIRGTRVTVAGPDYHEAKDPTGALNRHRSTAIVTRSDRTNLGELAIQMSDRIKAFPEIAPDRVLVGSYYRHPVAERMNLRGVAHFACHPNAAVRERDEDSALVRGYRRALLTTSAYALAAESSGFLIVVTGDFQVPGTFDRPFGPRRILADPLDLDLGFAVGIDHLWIDHRLEVRDTETRQLHDHTGFIADLVPR